MDLKLPNLGEGADSGTIITLLVKEGDQIKKDQPILELENEKAVATIPSTAAGTVTRLYVQPGDKISVGQNILSLTETDGGANTAKAPASSPKHQATRKSAQSETPPSPLSQADDLDQPAGGPVVAAPSIRKLAQDLGIDLTRVRGTERGGRIVIADLKAYLQRLQQSSARPAPAPQSPAARPSQAPAETESVDFSKWGPITKKPLTPLRQVIARRMAESWSTVPRVTQFDEADSTRIMELRKKYDAVYQQKGTRLTLTSFALKVVVDLLKKHPIFNSSLDLPANELVLKNYIHLGVAVDTEAGLLVPVIRDADKKSMLELSRELETLAARARDRKIAAEELKGGSFTISNQGGIGGAHFTPIVNRPEVAILGLGRGTAKPVVRDGKIEPRVMLPLALSYDHRVIDGAAAARFVVDLVQALQDFNEDQVRI